jgi:streptogramin lyase
VWFGERNTSGYYIGRITPNGTITDFPIPSGSNLTGLAAGPDGNIWFTEIAYTFSGGTPKIAKMSPTGSILSEYTVPSTFLSSGTSNVGPITSGPDGAMWFGEGGTTTQLAVGRVTVSGGFTEYRGASPNNSFSYGTRAMAFEPDGKLLLSEAILPYGFSNYLSEVTTGGTFANLNLSVGNVFSITPGPDGNVWFTNTAAAGSGVSSLSPSGTFTSYTDPTPVGAYAITCGPDGGLWFADDIDDQAGRVTTSGTFTNIPGLGSTNTNRQITTGPDGNLWISEYKPSISFNAIARLNPRAITVTGQSLSLKEGVSFSGKVATFSKPIIGDSLSNYGTPTINWGDNTSSSGTLSYANGLFTVTGTHTYAEEQATPYTITITVTDTQSQ